MLVIASGRIITTYPQFPQGRPIRIWGILTAAPTGGNVNDPIVVLRHKEMELARVRREVEALQIVVPLLDDPTERLPDLISSRKLAVPSEPGSLADLEIYYPFVKNLRLADNRAKQG